jgi:hypothetical protein
MPQPEQILENAEIPENPALPENLERRERRWQVFHLSEGDHERMRRLGPETGHVDRYAALQALTEVVEGMTADDLDPTPSKRPLKIGIPPLLDVAIRAKASEFGCTNVRLLLSAARLLIERAPRKRRRQKSV